MAARFLESYAGGDSLFTLYRHMRVKLHSRRGSTERTESQTEAVSNHSDNDADPRHFETGCPPRTDRDKRFQCADGKVRDETDSEGSENGIEAA
jgi:hypothetical protein